MTALAPSHAHTAWVAKAGTSVMNDIASGAYSGLISVMAVARSAREAGRKRRSAP